MDIISLRANERNGTLYSKTIIVDTSMIARVIRHDGSSSILYLHEYQDRNASTPFVTEYKVDESLDQIEAKAMDIVKVSVEEYAGTNVSVSPVDMAIPVGLAREVAKEDDSGRVGFTVSEEGISTTYKVSEDVDQVMSKVLDASFQDIVFDDSDGVATITTGATNGTVIGGPDGDKLAFFGGTPVEQQSALTASDSSTVDTTYGQEEADVINNLRTRVNELEARLQSYVLLP